MRSHPRQTGLTLVELLVGMAIAAVLGSFIYGLLTSVQRGSARASSKHLRVASARLILEDISQSVECAFPWPGEKGVRFAGGDNAGGPDDLTLVRPVRVDKSIEMQEIRYSASGQRIYRESGKPSQPGNERKRAPLGVDMAEDPGISAEMNVEFQPAGDASAAWTPSWDGQGLPGAVRITLTLSDAKYEDEPVVLEQTVRPRSRLAP